MPVNLLPVPHHKQHHQTDCLAACAAMLLDYLETPIRYRTLLNLLAITPDLGAPASNIRKLDSLGLSVLYEQGNLGNLATHLSQKRPCIVFINTLHLSYWKEESRHAVVITGMDKQKVYLNDPFFDVAPQIINRLEFTLAWDEMENTYAVITK